MAKGDKKRIQQYLKRKAPGKKPVGRILIVCEGEKTEPYYFQGLRDYLRMIPLVVIKGEGKNTFSLVKAAHEHATKAKQEKNPYESVWIVLDKDSFPLNNLEQAFKMAKNKRYHFILSNEAFELWFLLHYGYYDTALSRDQYGEKLTKKMEKKYNKNDSNIFTMLKPFMQTAINNAKKLAKTYPSESDTSEYVERNPYTAVYKLVEYLLKKRASQEETP